MRLNSLFIKGNPILGPSSPIAINLNDEIAKLMDSISSYDGNPDITRRIELRHNNRDYSIYISVNAGDKSADCFKPYKLTVA